MFICGRCGKPTKSGESMTKVPVETRPRIYKDGYGNVVGEGHEIVREIVVCRRCLAKEKSQKTP